MSKSNSMSNDSSIPGKEDKENFVVSQQAELIQTGLSCLQNDPNPAILNYNIAYLTVLVDAYRRTQIIARAQTIDRATFEKQSERIPIGPENDNPLPHLFHQHIDNEMREQFLRVLTSLASLTKQKNQKKKVYFSNKVRGVDPDSLQF